MSGSNTRTPEQANHAAITKWDSASGTWIPITASDLGGTGSGGTVDIDQTTPGTTNGVVVNSSALPTNAAKETGGHLASIDTVLNTSGHNAATVLESIDTAISGLYNDLDNGQGVPGFSVAGVQVFGQATASPPTYVEGQLWPPSLDLAGNLRVKLDTNAVTGPLTDTQLRATPVPVSGTVTATTGGLTDTQLRATPVPVSGIVTAGGPADLVTSGTLTLVNDVVSVALSGYPGLGIDISGTWTGTLIFKVSSNGGSSYSSAYVMNRASLALVSNTTANGSFIGINLAGADHLQVLWQTVLTGGPITIRFTQTAAPFPNTVLGGTAGSTSPSLVGYIGANWTIASILEPLQVAISPPGSTDFGLTVRQVPEYSTRSDTYTATANGTTVTVSTHTRQYFAIQVKCTTAPALSWDIVLEGSLDGTNYDTILEHTQATGDGKIIWSTVSTPCLYFRSRCVNTFLGDSTAVVATILGRY